MRKKSNKNKFSISKFRNAFLASAIIGALPAFYLANKVRASCEPFNREVIESLEGRVSEPIEAVSVTYTDKILLGAGHGGEDPGAIFPFDSKDPNYVEKEQNLKIAREAERLFVENGYTNVEMVRDDDTFVSLDDRAKMAGGVDVYVSFHTDSFKDRNAKGFTTHYRKGQNSKELAEIVQESLSVGIEAVYETDNRGIKNSKFRVLGGVDDEDAGVLVESGFSSNDKDRFFLENHYKVVARAVYDGVHKFLRSKDNVTYGEDDITLVTRLAYSEGGCLPEGAWRDIAYVVDNRVESKDYPGRVSEVINQPRAFSCVGGDNWKKSESASLRDSYENMVYDKCEAVVRNALNGKGSEVAWKDNVVAFYSGDKPSDSKYWEGMQNVATYENGKWNMTFCSLREK